MRYNPAAYVPGGASAPVARAIQTLGFRKKPVQARPVPYNPAAYVRGGAPLNVARATQALGRLGVNPRMAPRAVPRTIIGGGPRAIIPQANPALAEGGGGEGDFMGRANDMVFDMMNPLMQRLAASRVQAEQGARSAYAAHADALGKGLQASAVPITQSYDTAINSSAAVNEAVANRLKGEGGEATSGLNAQLAQISANPSTSQELGTTYQGAGGAGYASGAADIQHLLGQKAEAQAYTGKLPGIARIEGGRLLQQALSEMNQEFGERESGLFADAQDKSFGLANQFRGEDMDAKKEAKQDAKDAANTKLSISQADADRRQKDRATLLALRATAATKADQRAYDIKIKNWERANDVSDANAKRSAEVEANRVKYEQSAKSASDKQAFTAEQNRIDNSFTATQNAKNRAAKTTAASTTAAAKLQAARLTAAGKAAKAGKGATLPGKGKDTWQTGGSAKRQTVLNAVRSKIVNFDTGRIRQSFWDPKAGDKLISNRLWSEIRLQIGSTTSPAAKKLYREVFLSLENTPYRPGEVYGVPKFVSKKK